MEQGHADFSLLGTAVIVLFWKPDGDQER